MQPKIAVVRRQGDDLQAFDQNFSRSPVRYEVFDGADLEIVLPFKSDQVGQSRHGTVVVHHLRQHAGGRKTG